MIIRFHKGQFVDAVIPTAVQSGQPNRSPGDLVWQLPADINPSKTIQVTENVQAVDPVTGQPLFDSNGLPVWETTTVTDPVTGEEVQQIVTQQVPQTFTLLENPSIFTPADIAAVALSYEEV